MSAERGTSKRAGQKPRRAGGAFSGRGSGALRSLAALERPERAWPTARRLAGYFLPFRREISLAVVWVIAWAAADAAAPALTGRLVDAAVGAHGDLRAVVWPGVVLALTYV